jgi:hypothetical protein
MTGKRRNTPVSEHGVNLTFSCSFSSIIDCRFGFKLRTCYYDLIMICSISTLPNRFTFLERRRTKSFLLTRGTTRADLKSDRKADRDLPKLPDSMLTVRMSIRLVETWKCSIDCHRNRP